MARWSLLLFVLTNVPTAVMAANPVVMPFTLRYGQHGFGAWFGVPVKVGSQSFDLSVSTALTRTWIPGESLCTGNNVTECTLSLGGTWAGSVAGSVKVEDELLAGVYNKTLAPDLLVDRKLLGQEGVGGVITEAVSLEAGTGPVKLDAQSVGVIREADRERMANGYLSLQQMALSLYSSGSTPSPTFHLYHGASAYSADAVLKLEGIDSGRYFLIFGGYDRAMMDLNTTQQYPLVKTNINSGGGGTDKDDRPSTTEPLPASQDVGYRTEAMLDKLVYRWTGNGRTDNSLISKPTLAIIDSTTPYIWLPKSALAALVKVTGAVWNETLGVYTSPGQCGMCTEAEENSQAAVVDFTFEHTEGVPITIRFPYYFRIAYVPYEGWTATYMLQVRELPEGSPIILGRPFLSAVHLWVDYGERWFAMKEGYQGEGPELNSEVVPWDRGSHPPITNSSVLLVDSPSTTTTTTTSSSSSSAGSLTIGAVAGISTAAIVIILALAGVAFYIYSRKSEDESPVPSYMPTGGRIELPLTHPTRHKLHNYHHYQQQQHHHHHQQHNGSINELPADNPHAHYHYHHQHQHQPSEADSAAELESYDNYPPQPPAAYSPLAGPLGAYDQKTPYQYPSPTSPQPVVVYEMRASVPGRQYK